MLRRNLVAGEPSPRRTNHLDLVSVRHWCVEDTSRNCVPADRIESNGSASSQLAGVTGPQDVFSPGPPSGLTRPRGSGEGGDGRSQGSHVYRTQRRGGSPPNDLHCQWRGRQTSVWTPVVFDGGAVDAFPCVPTIR